MSWATVTEWENFMGYYMGFNSTRAEVITIFPLITADTAAEWGAPYKPGRKWSVQHADNSQTSGHSKDLRAAKKDALAALRAKETTNQDS